MKLEITKEARIYSKQNNVVTVESVSMAAVAATAMNHSCLGINPPNPRDTRKLLLMGLGLCF